MMPKKLFFVLSLTLILCWADSYPVELGSLEFDNLDTDIADLKYVPQGDLNDFLIPSEKDNSNEKKDENKSKNKINVSGFKKKSSDNKGVKVKYNIEDLKKFLKEAGLHDLGTFDDGAISSIAKVLANLGIAITGNEERKYKKGSKTKGFHKVSHKDEYKKDNEFYEDDETTGVIKKILGKGFEFDFNKVGGIKKGYFHHDRDKGLYGLEDISDKGKLNKEIEGFSDSQGFDAYFKSE